MSWKAAEAAVGRHGLFLFGSATAQDGADLAAASNSLAVLQWMTSR